MPLGEFDLIERYFARPTRADARIALGVGDDCALLAPSPGMQLAVSTDTLVEGRHFLPTVDARALGHKALAVNLSDLAACGAAPLAFTLAITLQRVDEAFLEGFSAGLLALADAHRIALVGGDTTGGGPLSITITVFGEVPTGQALLRSGARAGDDLWVSGATLGDARLALQALLGTVALAQGDLDQVRPAMERPQPRIALGQALRGVATAAIDVSDGLLGDLQHVLRRSGRPGAPLGATIHAEALPRSSVLARQSPALQHQCLLAGGDDYELLFTAGADRQADVLAAGRSAGTAVSRIGRIEAAPGVRVLDAQGHVIDTAWPSFDHFASA
jgi:thiamine-monophosphate kinase